MDNLQEKERIEMECSGELMAFYGFLQKTIGKYPTRGIIINRPILRHCVQRMEQTVNFLTSDLHLLGYLDWRTNMETKENGNGTA